jgi:cyclase
LQAVRVYNLRDVDELVFLDISTNSDTPNLDLMADIMADAYMPITLGGKIRSIADIQKLLTVGADKVCLSTAAITDPEFIKSAINTFGGQAIVIALNYYYDITGKPKIVTNPPYKIHDINAYDVLAVLATFGVSEFILTCVNCEGKMQGYDLNFLKHLDHALHAGIILNGGAGTYSDMLNAFQQFELAGVAAASMFHYTEQTPIEARQFLNQHGIHTRR